MKLKKKKHQFPIPSDVLYQILCQMETLYTDVKLDYFFAELNYLVELETCDTNSEMRREDILQFYLNLS
jgi:hypothetical protein